MAESSFFLSEIILAKCFLSQTLVLFFIVGVIQSRIRSVQIVSRLWKFEQVSFLIGVMLYLRAHLLLLIYLLEVCY